MTRTRRRGTPCTQECRLAFETALPRIQTHAEIKFRNVRCPGKRDELTAEAIALSWKWWRTLWERGKDPSTFVSAIASFAVKAARCGRRLCGQDKAKDVLSPRAQQQNEFTVSTLPSFATLTYNPFAEALADNTRTPVDEQVAFRIDFPSWLQSWDDRRRRIIEAMGNGERTLDLSNQFGMSPGRVSQLRREFLVSWEMFLEA